MAQTVAPPLTVEEAVNIAVKNNPSLSAAIRDVSAARSAVRSAQALNDPSILFSPGVTSLSGTGEELLISQPLELNGTRSARTGIANARLRQIQAQSLLELRGLVFAVKSAYYELVKSREQLALTRDLLTAAEEFDRICRRQVELGSRPGIDQVQTELEALRARQQARLAESQTVSALAVLNTHLGRAPLTPIETRTLLAVPIQSFEREPLLQKALQDRAEISVELAAGDAFRQEARLTRAQGLPDIAPQFRAGSVTRRFGDYGFGIVISLPLFDLGSRKNRIRQAEESARAQGDRTKAARDRILLEVEQALERLNSAEATLKEYDQGLVEKSRRLLDASRKGLEAGQTGIVAVLEAQRTFRAVQTERINALLTYALARTELERATGGASATLLSARETKGENKK